jgi:hypothetical protein
MLLNRRIVLFEQDSVGKAIGIWMALRASDDLEEEADI